MGLRWLMVIILMCLHAPLAGAEGKEGVAVGQNIDGPLTWADCLREAAQHHPDLISAKESVTQQQEAQTIAASGRWPQASADLGATSSWSSRSGSGNAYSYGVSASQLLFDGFKAANTVRSSKENVKAAEAGYLFTSAGVRYRLRSAFIDLLKAQELQSLTQEIARIRKSNLDLIELRYKAGMEHKGALLTARANAAQAQSGIDSAARDLESARQQMIKELGRTQLTAVSVSGVLDAGETDVQKPDLAALALHNPSLQRISAQKRSAGFSLNADRGDFWPTVSLSGDVSRSDTRWPAEDQGSSAGVRVSLPLFAGGARVARLNQARSVYRQMAEEERSIKDGIILTLEQSWNVYRDAVDAVGIQKNFLDATEERAKIARQQYTVGLVTFDNWTIIEDGLVSGKRSYLDAQAGALLAEAAWVQAKGETLEYAK